MNEPDAAAAYPGIIQGLQQQGFAKNAPPDYPGHAAVQGMVQSTIPIGQQYQYGILTAPGVTDAIKAASAPLTFGNTGTGGTAAGGGTTTPGTPPGGSGVAGPRASTALGQGMQIGNAQAIRDGLVARGMDPETALAMAANSLGESGGNWQTAPGDSGVSHGLFQWNGDRLAAFQAANGGKLPEQTSLGAQLDFAANEWKADHNGAATAAGQFNTAEGKIAPIVSKYEVSANQPADIARRSAYLNQLRAAGVGQGGTQGTATATAVSPTPLNPNAGPRATAVVAPSPIALRTGGTDVAGPGAGPGLPDVPAPNQMYQTGLPGIQIAGPASNALAPPPVAAPSPPVATAAAHSSSPAAATPPAAGQPPATGQNSPQFQAALELNRRAQALDMVVDPTGRTKALAASLRAQAALYMQADSVSYDPVTGIGTKALTGERLNAAAPNARYVWDPDRGAYVDQSGTHPPVTPPSPRLTNVPGVGVVQSKPGGGADVVVPMNPQGIATQAAAQAQGSGVGGDVAKQLPALVAQGRDATQAIGNIDYGMSQLQKAQQGGINTGPTSRRL